MAATLVGHAFMYSACHCGQQEEPMLKVNVYYLHRSLSLILRRLNHLFDAIILIDNQGERPNCISGKIKRSNAYFASRVIKLKCLSTMAIPLSAVAV